jgi:hypothetical protein
MLTLTNRLEGQAILAVLEGLKICFARLEVSEPISVEVGCLTVLSTFQHFESVL